MDLSAEAVAGNIVYDLIYYPPAHFSKTNVFHLYGIFTYFIISFLIVQRDPKSLFHTSQLECKEESQMPSHPVHTCG